MASSPAETIKEKLDIVEFLKGYLTLTPAGKNFKALCPFHSEKTPSFMVSPERQSWHCFGCNLGGDVFSFLMRYENIEFGEALRILAEKSGVELRRLNPAEYKYIGLLYELQETAKRFFQRALESSDAARAYLAERGLKKETVEEFELGWAPNDPEALTLHFLNAGVNPDDILRAGLSVKTERGRPLDRFRGRIMFPIHNHTGKVVGFTGRLLPQFDTGEMGKYMNSPETPIYSKSRLLYGFWKSKNAIREAGSTFLVEGQMDFLMSWQLGIKNVVATSGTALTEDHLRTLRRLADSIVFLFDNDAAGARAEERGEILPESKYKKVVGGLQKGEEVLDLSLTTDFDVKIVTLGKFKDPAEAVVGDIEYFKNAIQHPKSIIRVYMERYLPVDVDYGRRENLNNLRIVIRKIKNIASAVQRDFWLKELASRTGIKEKTLAEEMERLEAKAFARESVAEEPNEAKRVFTRWSLLGQELLAAAAAKSDWGLLESHREYLSAECEEVLRLLRSGERRSSDPLVDEIMNLVLLRAPEWTGEDIEALKTHLMRECFKMRRRELTQRVREAEARGDEATLKQALSEFNQLPAL